MLYRFLLATGRPMSLPFPPEILAALALAALVAGLVRGFSGFGAGMIFIPVAAALAGPKIAVVTLWIMDTLPTLTIVIPALKRVEWRSILPIAAGYAVTVWAGVWLLANGDPHALRWAISLAILATVPVLWSGWRYRGARPFVLSAGVGGVSGIMGGAAQLSGPPVLIYWLASDDPAWRIRANVIVLFFALSALSGTSMAVNGLFDLDAVMAGVICAPVFGLALLIGQRGFAHATDAGYRRFAFVLILIVAIATLPVFGG